MTRTRSRWNTASGAAAAVLIAIAAGQPAASASPELADRIGEWGGTWANADTRNEIRIDAATAKEANGTFCGTRKSDGSVFFFDFDKVKSKVKADSVKLKRRKHTHWVTATANGVELGIDAKTRGDTE